MNALARIPAIVLASLGLVAACTQGPAPVVAPSEASPGTAGAPATPGRTRSWIAKRGETEVRFSNASGPLVDSTAPPPMPGEKLPPPPPNMSGSCSGDALGCSKAGELLRASKTAEELVDRLRGAGFSVVEQPSQPAPASPPGLPGAPPPPPILSEVDARALAGKKTRARGRAEDAKLSAAILGEDVIVYCLAVTGWPRDVRGKVITIEGVLERTDDFRSRSDGGLVTQGTGEAVWVMRGCRRVD